MIDTSQKYERYQMMNYIYGTIFDYNNNIKPAPDPHYLLDKFYGNMSIEEYRALLPSQNFVMFIEKPLTHSFPELHDENYEQLSTKDKIIPSSSSFQVKRKSKSDFKERNNDGKFWIFLAFIFKQFVIYWYESSTIFLNISIYYTTWCFKIC